MQLTDLEVGKTYNGAVVSVTDFGAFVNVGCATDGLLHISQISTEFVRSVAEAVTVGQDISVRILSVDSDRKKFSVTAIPEGYEPPARQSRNNDYYEDSNDSGSFARDQERPRQARAQKGGDRRSRGNREPCPVNSGDVVTGPVASVAPFGIFIDLGAGYTGMLHSSQMKLPEGVEDHMRHYNQGDEVEVRVLSVARGGEKVALTQKSDEEIASEERTRTKGLSAGERYDRY
jgi:predicted RNA-binding protein with RPS1 domain